MNENMSTANWAETVYIMDGFLILPNVRYFRTEKYIRPGITCKFVGGPSNGVVAVSGE